MKRKILNYVKENPYARFSDLVSFHDGRRNELVLIINNLVDQGELIKEDDTFITPYSLGLIRATVACVKATYAFLSLDEDDEDVVVEQENLMGALLNDVVYLKYRNFFKVVKIVKRNRQEVVGEILSTAKKTILKVKAIATNNIDFIINSTEYKSGQIVRCSIDKYDDNNIYVNVIEVLGDKNAPGVDITRILLEHDCPIEFSDEVERYVSDISLKLRPEDYQGRIDLREEYIITIDGADAKDLDDAISINCVGKNYEIGIHIADVSHYVIKDSPLDKEAFARGTSIYVTDRVVPMLPFVLSNGICSLNPNVERLAISCVVTLNENFEKVSSKIFPSIIESKKRLTYDYVNDVIKNNDKTTELHEKIMLLHEVATRLRQQKFVRGCLDLSIPEIKIIVDSDGFPIDIKKRTQKDGEKLIEDLMILANETIAERINHAKLPFIYRVHENPAAKRIGSFISFASRLGFKPSFSALNVTPKAVQKIILDAAKTDVSMILSQVLLRSLAKARYSAQNLGHFGLASKCYTHFTSPIRRYPDLIVHRLLRNYLFNEDKALKVTSEELALVAENTSFKERRAITVEREANDMKCAEYMAQFIGEEFQGFISGMINSGIFIDLENGASGKLRFDEMNDFYQIDQNGHKAYGRRSGKSFNLGDILTVVLVSASKENGEITFKLKDEPKRNSKGPYRRFKK